MRVPVEWILEYAPVDLSAAEIARTLTMAGLEVEESEETDSGTILSIKVTPNRGDCLSVLGIARELAAATGVPYAGRPPCPCSRDEPPDACTYTAVSIEDPQLCPRYAARIVENLRVAESPVWMQRRLIAAGMRPISNIVDITNYVMLETGQPLHAFDYDTLEERRIVVRRARGSERLRTLDGVDRELGPEMLVIADATRPVALAGIMGGADTEITASTRTLLLESAHFDRRCIRRTARALSLNTEASYRFERIVDPEGVVYAADLVCKLIAELGAGNPVPGVVDEYPARRAATPIRLRLERCALLMGYRPAREEVIRALNRLGFALKEVEDGIWSVVPPSWRPDIQREVDLVEEVARVLGYDRIPERLMVGATTRGGDSDLGRFCDAVRDSLAGAGLQEVSCHGLLAPTPLDDSGDGRERVEIRSAMSSELSGLRRSLVPGLCDVASRNARRGLGPLAFFEVGRVFSKSGNGRYDERTHVGAIVAGNLAPKSWLRLERTGEQFFTGKGLVERLLEHLHCEGRFTPGADHRLHPGRQADIVVGDRKIGVVGELHPSLYEELHLRDRAVVFELSVEDLYSSARETVAATVEISRYPAVTRDLAPRVPLTVPFDRVQKLVVDVAGPILESLALTDVYSGPPLPQGTRSLTLSLVFRAADRTLTDAEVDALMQTTRDRLRAEVGAAFQEIG